MSSFASSLNTLRLYFTVYTSTGNYKKHTRVKQKANKCILHSLLRLRKMIPKYFFLTKGVGKHKEQLQSFELALRDAGIQFCNLVNVSSIVPPGCEQVPREKGLKMVQPGEITFVVLARNATNEPHRLVVSSIGVAPRKGNLHRLKWICGYRLKMKDFKIRFRVHEQILAI